MLVAHCASCGSENVREHCPDGPTCTWVSCRACKAVMGMAYGALRVIGGR